MLSQSNQKVKKEKAEVNTRSQKEPECRDESDNESDGTKKRVTRGTLDQAKDTPPVTKVKEEEPSEGPEESLVAGRTPRRRVRI